MSVSVDYVSIFGNRISVKTGQVHILPDGATGADKTISATSKTRNSSRLDEHALIFISKVLDCPMAQKQFSLFNKKTLKRYNQTVHGGLESKGRRKEARPFAPRAWVHLVLKSEKATGKMSFLSPKNKVWIESYIYEMARRYYVSIGDYINAGNHLHIKIRVNQKTQFKRFLRIVPGRIASHVTGACKGNKFGRFWQGLAYTRVLRTSFEDLRLRGYFEANRVEVWEGKLGREDFLDKFNAWLRQLRKTGPTTQTPAWA